MRTGPDVHVTIAAAPAYLAAHPPPGEPQGLATHRRLRSQMPTHNDIFAWRLERGTARSGG